MFLSPEVTMNVPTRTPIPTETPIPSPTLTPTPPYISIRPLPTATPLGLPTQQVPISLLTYYDANGNGQRVEVGARIGDLLPDRLGVEQFVVHLPELPLGGGAHGRDGRRHGVGVHGEGEIEIGEPDLPGIDVLLLDGAEGFVVEFLAPGALEVGHFDEPDAGRGVAGDPPLVGGSHERGVLGGDWAGALRAEEGRERSAREGAGQGATTGQVQGQGAGSNSRCGDTLTRRFARVTHRFRSKHDEGVMDLSKM